MKIFSELPAIPVKNKLIPKIMIGSSPFLGAGQFGEKAPIYYEQFAKHPENVVKLLVKSVEFGIPAIQIFPEAWLIGAVKRAEKITGKKIYVIANIGYHSTKAEDDLKRLAGLNLQAILTHASISDTLNKNLIEGWIEKMKEFDVLTGFATHTPSRTLPFMERNLVLDIAMVPINPIGYMVNSADMEAIKNSKLILIGKKTLAAGKLKPKEALEFAYKYVDSIAIGITSEKEMVEAYNAAKNVIV